MTAEQALKEMREVTEISGAMAFEWADSIEAELAAYEASLNQILLERTAALKAKDEQIKLLSDDADRLRRELDDANGVIR